MFFSPLYKACKRMEQALLAMPELRYEALDTATWLVVRGSAVMLVALANMGVREIQLNLRSNVVIGADIQPDLLAYLLQANANILFGGFALDEEGIIVYRYATIATQAGSGQIREAIRSFAKTVDDYDNKIIRKWGGETCHSVLFGIEA